MTSPAWKSYPSLLSISFKLGKGKPFIFTAEVAVKPEVGLSKYKGITVTKIDTTVSDEEVRERR